MVQTISEVSKIRRRVLIEVARSLYKGSLVEDIESIPQKLIDDGITHYRCCKYKEMAILKERIKLAMGIDISKEDSDKSLSDCVEEILSKSKKLIESKNDRGIISIIEEACDQCPIDKIVVTNACRNCVAHSCVNSCPKQAITIVGNKAYISKDQCIECGLCTKACSYGAIIEVDRPCNRACSVRAVVPGNKTIAKIDSSLCVECGQCIIACPFGAISSKSEIVNVIKLLGDEEHKIVALIAPSYIGQFGKGVNWSKLVYALKKIGFYDVVMVATGADKVTEKEGMELIEKKENNEGILFNSCCPSFKNLIQIHYPELSANISNIESPMLETARMVMDIDETFDCIFIGPCIAKKGEAVREGKDLIDGVLTFEELIAMFVANEINLAEIELDEGELNSNLDMCLPSRDKKLSFASSNAVNFCRNDGVGQAVLSNIAKKNPDLSFDSNSVSGIADCKSLLKKISKGKEHYDFVEGMGCSDGCIGGPGVLEKSAKVRGILKKEVPVKSN